MASAVSKGLLHGVRVLDMTRILAGPFATMMLGDMGADIIKVEEPNFGDDTRSWGPPFVGDNNEESAYFLSVNRNKRSIGVNLKHEEGMAIIHKLARVSDIFVENYLPGKLDKLGCGYQQLKEINPGLIYCSITGYGPDGPYANRAGYDVIAASLGGLNHVTGPVDGDPCRTGVAMTDICTGLVANGAILAALYSRNSSGVGQKIDCDLLSTNVAAMSHIASNYLNAGVEAQRWGSGHGSIVPYQAFKTKDGRFLTVGTGNDNHFKNLCRLCELDHLPDDVRFAHNKDRVANRGVLIAILSVKFQEQTCDEWLQVLEGASFPFGEVNTVGEALNNKQVLHNNMIMEMEHPGLGQKVHVAASPVRFNLQAKDNSYRYPPPSLGGDTRDILKNVINLTDDQVDDLIRQKAVTEKKL